MPQSRSGHRVTFATAQQVSPIQYPHDDSPSPVTPTYIEQSNMVMGGVPVYPKSSAHMPQPSYMPGMHIVSQQMAPIYRQPPSGNPILTGPFARRPVTPYGFQQNLMARSHIQLSPFQHGQPPNPPPHPAELPKPVFRSSLYSQSGGAESLRAPSMHGQVNHADSALEQMMKMQRPTDLNYLQQMHSNPNFNLATLSPTSHDPSLAQRPACPTMAAQFPNRPAMNAAVMQQLRLQEMNLSNEMTNDLTVPGDPASMAFQGQNPMKFNYPNPGIDFPSFGSKPRPPQLQMMARTQSGVHPAATDVLAGRQESDMARLQPEVNRNYFPGNFMATSNPIPAAGSNNTSSTSSPTPVSLAQLNTATNSSESPQAGGMNFTGALNICINSFEKILPQGSSKATTMWLCVHFGHRKQCESLHSTTFNT